MAGDSDTDSGFMGADIHGSGKFVSLAVGDYQRSRVA